MNKVLVTGSSGFIGRELVKQLLQFGKTVVAHSRSHVIEQCQNAHIELMPDSSWMPALDNVDTVIHCAARVHQMDETEEEAQRAYDIVNVQATLSLAEQAVKMGVKRFVFVSSIKVNGEWNAPDVAFQHDDLPHPIDEYGKSKLSAEEQLKNLCLDSDMELVIIRPPLVYGPGVKANFYSLLRVIDKGIPLPFGCIKTTRSLVFVKNLVDLILVVCTHSRAPGQTFMVSDDDDVTVSGLFRAVAKHMNRPTRLIPVPQELLKLMLTLIGKKAVAQRLCLPLQVNISHTKSLLNWTPPYSFSEGLKETVDCYLEHKG
ncbi:UDP-glucose 4-epimerase family protein [Vibrio viridaestus]|uniref:SDR family oxidoreductase n=1 Tax=Vibrio viridaestus TaxID=2487322 RepID=A0A3N9TBZ0_9VIBR|nr:SDR family oxidoreductase [Vibrio viridaestus]RQW61707.1 SDR family oxidoreductase [Vibrio viridaestus]